MIAALYVDPLGPYFGRDDVDPWDEKRDARLYAGPWPVVARAPYGRSSECVARHGRSRFESGTGPDQPHRTLPASRTPRLDWSADRVDPVVPRLATEGKSSRRWAAGNDPDQEVA